MLLIVCDCSTPGRPVDEAFTLRGGAFLFQRVYGGGLGQAVQRHVDQRCVAARRGGTRPGSEALPFGASGLVDVDVRVYQSGEERVVAAVVDDGVGGNLRGAADSPDLLVFHEKHAGPRTLRGDDAFRDVGMCHNLIIP